MMYAPLTGSCMGAVLLGLSSVSYAAINDAPADVDSVVLRSSCYVNGSSGTEIPNCFTSMDHVDAWLTNVRLPDASRPTLIDVGPGIFTRWQCTSSHVTVRGAGRDRTTISNVGGGYALDINQGCTNLNVQDLKIDGRDGLWGVVVFNLEAVTSWTNVEILGAAYAWVESISPCTSNIGKHTWFSSRIVSSGGTQASGSPTISRAYTATCAESWFWGSEITAYGDRGNAFAIQAHDAEIHLYGSNVRLLISTTNSSPFSPSGAGGLGRYLIAALNGSAVHIHGTGLDIVHAMGGTVDMLYTDDNPESHFHANASAFNIHLSGAGKVNRIRSAGSGRIEAPYQWGEGTQPPLTINSHGMPSPNGVQTLVSRTGADTYVETDCPATGSCSLGGNFPREMIYRAECTNTGATQGPWFDTVTRACRN